VAHLCAPETRTTERVYVAATKASPATDEPVKRTAAKAPAKKAPAKKAAKSAPAKATKSAPAKATKRAAKKATSGAGDDDLAVDDDALEAEPGDELEVDDTEIVLDDIEVEDDTTADDDAEDEESDDEAAAPGVAAPKAAGKAAKDDDSLPEPSEKDKASGDFVWDEEESEALRQARTIRIPVHMVEVINKLGRIQRELLQDLGREPTPEELAKEMDITPEKVLEIQQYAREPISLDQTIGDEGDSQLGDFIEDSEAVVAVDAVSFTLLQDQLQSVLETLSEREAGVVRLRFGLTDGQPRTLDEIGQVYGVTRERIRQIESKTMSKLRHPSRSQVLRDYLD
jgi:hypothetical protein